MTTHDDAAAGSPGDQGDLVAELPGADDDFGLAPRPASGGRRRSRPVDPFVGRDIGGVRIISLLGEGGMGRVYQGEQLRPLRTVAVKVVRPGVTPDTAARRFENEAAFLARLQHPGIAQIFVVGTYASDFGDVPYFVMEHVADARPITQYARDEGLPLPHRLALFAEVCDAVAHGHARGVVHRDLKPGNILVDGEGRPKVIDFGVARSIDSDIRTTRHTQVFVGTLHHMAPEQFAAPDSGPTIDSRTDVYALGVLLYELVAGTLPHDLSRKAVHEAARAVCEDAPVPLAVREPRCPEDVSRIAARCLAKAPRDRYADAGEVAADVRRY
jgi:serine/threonine protein kinase